MNVLYGCAGVGKEVMMRVVSRKSQGPVTLASDFLSKLKWRDSNIVFERDSTKYPSQIDV